MCNACLRIYELSYVTYRIMKIERIKTKICIRKVYVPPMALFEGVEDSKGIMAGSIKVGGSGDTGSGEGDNEGPVRGNRTATTSFFEDPVALEDYSLDVESYN